MITPFALRVLVLCCCVRISNLGHDTRQNRYTGYCTTRVLASESSRTSKSSYDNDDNNEETYKGVAKVLEVVKDDYNRIV